METAGTPFHKPVMVREAVESLRCRPGGIYVDGTVGGGGHALAILKASAPDGILIGIDEDDDALSESEKALHAFGGRKILRKGNFVDVDRILAGLHIGPVDGLLLDLGVSSHQLDRAERGFSFSSDAPLDMRMDRRRKVCAADLVKSLPEKELAKIIRDYGEEAKAVRIAGAIAARRKVAPIETTSELASLIAKTVGASGRRGKIHPATRTFQALRIAVNEELENLHGTIVRSVPCLKKGGRFSIISFHSLEDRIVKNTFRSLEKGCICPADLPLCRCGREPQLKVLTKRPVTPGPGEIEENPRSRSAKLRTAERI
ncbi:MAG TPA: 16S rRNA (cytosine(1402)-N(4))-methyltransferase RsmH [Syntrophales bacterium]|nr:16S rRNA (cytosine(1402)-N(4))-methyltransferase RsmH [Syntrophales bacterium]HRT61100.1 16S rRNA (cytosine(1402)-N(4))-methyltransferase RsmH [Syntrophales bacterium]